MRITINSNNGRTFYNGQPGCFMRLMLMMIVLYLNYLEKQ